MSFTGNMPATLFWECLLRIFLAALCGLVIGFERKARLKEAGVRTHLIVALGAALITIVSKYGFLTLHCLPRASRQIPRVLRPRS